MFSFSVDLVFYLEREEYEEMYHLLQKEAGTKCRSGHYQEAMLLYESCLKIAKNLGERIREGVANAKLACCYFGMKDYKKAIEFWELSRDFMEESDNKDFKFHVYTCLGDAYFNLKRFKKAIDNYQIGLKIIEETGDVAKRGNMYKILSETSSRTGDYKWAIHYQELRLKASKEMGDRTEELNAYFQLAAACYHSKDSERAIQFCELYLNDSNLPAERSEEGTVCLILSNACLKTGDFERAVAYRQRSLDQLGDKTSQGNAYSEIGKAYRDLGDSKKSMEWFNQHLLFAKENGDRPGEGRALESIGDAHLRLGNFKAAITDFELCLEIAKEIGEKTREATALEGLGLAHDYLGHFKAAMELFELELQVAQYTGDKKLEISSYCNLGSTCLHLGNFKQALVFHTQLLNIVKESGDRKGEGVAYGSLGNVYYKLGFLKEAIENHERQLEIVKEQRDREEEAVVYGNLGNDYRSLGNLQKAKHYYERNLKIAKEIKAKALEVGVYANLGIVYRHMKDFEKAIENHNRNLEMCKKVGDRPGEGRAYGNLGLAYTDLGDLEKALEYNKLCLEVAKEVEDKASEGYAYGNIGKTYFAQGDCDRALQYHECQRKIAIEVGDEIGQAIGNFNVGSVFEKMDSLCKALHYIESSVKILNDMRTRLLSNDEWKIGLRDVHKMVYAGLWRVLINQEKIREGLIAAEQGRAQALKDLMGSNYGLKTANGRRTAQEMSINDTLSCISSVIVFTAKYSHLTCHWVLQKESVCLRKLSIAYNIQWMLEAAREKIGVRDGAQCEDRSLDRLRNNEEESEGCVQRRPAALPNQDNPFRALYELTISPIIDLIHGDELIVVPEGPLWLAPYAAFMDPNSRYLSESFRIRFIPSLLTLKLILDCPADYHAKNGALLVGDPWVEEVKLKQLPCARREVELIAEILHTTPLTGKEATKDEVLKQLSNVALVHIAAHGRMETGEIALSPNPTRASEKPSDEDFLLRMSDVLNIRLRARLVVLSCCHSGRGEIKAEGVVGIARAFLGAGARSVLVSLWAIDDKATLEFMKYFYQHLVEGESASKSLNQAMKFMRESDEFSDVKYWAPFVLIGDDVTLEFQGSH